MAMANPLLADFARAARVGSKRAWMRGLVPHQGPQSDFFDSEANIVIFGGAAGPGKTWSLLVEPLRHAHVPRFGCVIFRRELTRITNEGGMWDEACNLYLPLGATKRQSPRMEFNLGRSKIQFGHLEHEDTKHAWSGSQICLLGFDQLEEFTSGQFWFLQGRNRSACGVVPYVRATANPVPPDDPVGGWLAQLIQWWWDPETGYPIYERGGVVRWLVRIDEEIRWADTREDAVALALKARVPAEDAERMPLSLTFIPGDVDDNPSMDPGYVAKLHALALVDRERLLRGNWKIRPQAGLVFNRAWFGMPVDARPAKAVAVRGWDKAASPGSGDYTSGLLLEYAEGIFYISDLTRGQWSYGERNKVIQQVTKADGQSVDVWLEQEPGSGGKESAERSVMQLAGYNVRVETAKGKKLDRAKPAAAQAEVGNIRLVKGDWNEGFLQRVHNFTGAEGGKDDDVDALSLAFSKLAAKVTGPQPKIGKAEPRADKPPLAERMRKRDERRALKIVERLMRRGR